ncbi:ankyrin repeat-containing domain protein [Xylariaceae sp. FL1019]|nr:ankyrin repeat-containing domain protein [Xylariaceae sp. FL1019]
MPLLALPHELLAEILESVLVPAWVAEPMVSEDPGVIWRPYCGPSSTTTPIRITEWNLTALRSVCKKFNTVVSYWALRTHRHGLVKLTPPWHDIPTIEWLVATRIRAQMTSKSGLEAHVDKCINAIQTWRRVHGEEILPYDTYLRQICKLLAVCKHPLRLLRWLETAPGGTRSLDTTAEGSSNVDTDTPDMWGHRVVQALEAPQGLQIAAFLGETVMVQTLLEHGADPNYRQHFGSALFAAAYNGHTEIASLLIEHGADLDTDESLGTPLDAAAHQGHTETMALLLEHTTAQLRNTSLLHAIAQGHSKAAELLLLCGKIEIHSQSPFTQLSSLLQPVNPHREQLSARNYDPAIPKLLYGYFTSTIPIMQAVCSDNDQILELLLRREDIDPNTCQGRRSALTAAVECEKDEMVRLLLLHPDTKTDLIDPSGDRAIEFAMKVMSDTIPPLIIERWRRDGLSIPQGCDSEANVHCLLTLALKNGLKNTSEMLLPDAELAERCDHCKQDLFGFAASRGLTTLVAALRTKDIDVNGQFLNYPSCFDQLTSQSTSRFTPQFCTPLMAAIESGHAQMVQMLLSWPEVNPNHTPGGRGGPEFNALGTAISREEPEMVKYLLERPDIILEVQYFNEWPPLYTAVRSENQLAVEMILRHPAANPNVDFEDDTALSCAITEGQLHAVRCFLEHPSTDFTEALHYLMLMWVLPNHTHELVLKLLLEYPGKIDPNFESERVYEFKAPLLFFADEGSGNMVELLLQHPDINPNISTDTGKTALYIAEQKGHNDVVQLLLNHPDTDPSLRWEFAWDPFDSDGTIITQLFHID